MQRRDNWYIHNLGSDTSRDINLLKPRSAEKILQLYYSSGYVEVCQNRANVAMNFFIPRNIGIS
jgi:hypothetical protein